MSEKLAIDNVEKPLVVDANGLAVLISAKLRTVRAYDASGKIPSPVRIGGKVLWRVEEIKRWLAAGAPSREVWAAMCAARK